MTVKLSPVFNDQTLDANGNPAVGYKLFAYAAGSSTKQTTYADSAGLVPQTNPIILNSLGYPTNGPIWLTSGQQYKFVLTAPTDTDPPTSPIKTIDNVTGVNDSSISVTQWVASGVTPTYVGASSFTLVGDQTSEFHVGRRLQFTVAAGTVYGTILTSAYAAQTTVTMTMDAANVLDNGLSAVNLSLLRADVIALPKRAYDITSLSMSGALAGATDITSTGNTILGDASTDTLNVGNGDIIKDASSNVGIGISPTQRLHVNKAAGNIFSGIRVQNNNSGTGLAGVEFVSDSTYAKSAFAHVRTGANGFGYVGAYVSSGTTAAEWTTTDEVARFDTNWKIKSLATSKGWVNFDGSLTGTITPRASFNVSSVTKNATGDYTLNLTNALTDTSAAVNTSVTANNTITTGISLFGFSEFSVTSTTAIRVRVFSYVGSSNTVNGFDAGTVAVGIYGR